MKYTIIKRLLLLMNIVTISFVLSACGGESKDNKTEKNAKVDKEGVASDFDGNKIEIVNIADGKFSKTLSKSFKKESYSKKEEKLIGTVKSVLDSVDLEKDNKILECIYGDIESDISVWSLLKNRDDSSLDNYGIIIRYEGKNFSFADICHGNNPYVDVNEDNGQILLAGGVMEGTGTHTEAVYVFSAKDGKVEQTGFVDPYDVQNYFAEYLKFDADNNNIKFKHNDKTILDFTNTEDGQGTLRAIAIGDQISFDFDDEHNMKVNVTPGLQFVSVITAEQVQKDVVMGQVVLVASNSEYVAVVTDDQNSNKTAEDIEKITSNNPQAANIGTSVVLVYDNMPTFTADVKINKDKVEFSNIEVGE